MASGKLIRALLPGRRSGVKESPGRGTLCSYRCVHHVVRRIECQRTAGVGHAAHMGWQWVIGQTEGMVGRPISPWDVAM